MLVRPLGLRLAHPHVFVSVFPPRLSRNARSLFNPPSCSLAFSSSSRSRSTPLLGQPAARSAALARRLAFLPPRQRQPATCAVRQATSSSHARIFNFTTSPSRLRSPVRVRIAGATTALVGLALGLVASVAQTPAISCDGGEHNAPGLEDRRAALIDESQLPPPPQSSLEPLSLSFGLVSGVCAGIFVKKGAKALAFVLGGIFVVLQYFVSLHWIRVDWSKAESRFQKLFYTQSESTAGAHGQTTPQMRPMTLGQVWCWLVDFLTTDFQPRASFIAGMALGLRVG